MAAAPPNGPAAGGRRGSKPEIHTETLTQATLDLWHDATRIVIMGAGGLGGYFGARFAASGDDVAFVARGAHLAAIRQHGLRVTNFRVCHGRRSTRSARDVGRGSV